MASAEAVAFSVNKLYASKGRQVSEMTLEAYVTALDPRSDWQVLNGAEEAIRMAGDWPVDAGTLNEMAAQYPREDPSTRPPEPPKRLPRPTPRKTVREAMKEECRRIIAGPCPKQADFCRVLLRRLEANDSDNPLATILPSMVDP